MATIEVHYDNDVMIDKHTQLIMYKVELCKQLLDANPGYLKRLKIRLNEVSDSIKYLESIIVVPRDE